MEFTEEVFNGIKAENESLKASISSLEESLKTLIESQKKPEPEKPEPKKPEPEAPINVEIDMEEIARREAEKLINRQNIMQKANSDLYTGALTAIDENWRQWDTSRIETAVKGIEQATLRLKPVTTTPGNLKTPEQYHQEWEEQQAKKWGVK